MIVIIYHQIISPSANEHEFWMTLTTKLTCCWCIDYSLFQDCTGYRSKKQDSLCLAVWTSQLTVMTWIPFVKTWVPPRWVGKRIMMSCRKFASLVCVWRSSLSVLRRQIWTVRKYCLGWAVILGHFFRFQVVPLCVSYKVKQIVSV